MTKVFILAFDLRQWRKSRQTHTCLMSFPSEIQISHYQVNISTNIISYHIISYHIISYHIISYHIISYHIISYHIITYRTVSYRIISYHIISYHIISYHIIYHIISYHIISYNLFLSVDLYRITKSIWIWKWSHSYKSYCTIIKVYNSYMVHNIWLPHIVGYLVWYMIKLWHA
jgi:hypothetical protein